MIVVKAFTERDVSRNSCAVLDKVVQFDYLCT